MKENMKSDFEAVQLAKQYAGGADGYCRFKMSHIFKKAAFLAGYNAAREELLRCQEELEFTRTQLKLAEERLMIFEANRIC